MTLGNRPMAKKIVADFETTFLLDAGAGTGKTQLLVNRLLAILRSGRSSLNRIAVITFTEKAAEELRLRTRRELESIQQRSASETERLILQDALSYLNRALITTIHSFCATMLRERAIELGVDPDFKILNELEAKLIRDSLWEEWINAPSDANTILLEDTLRAGLSIPSINALREFLETERDCLSWLPEPVEVSVQHYSEEIASMTAGLAGLQSSCRDKSDKVFEALSVLQESIPKAFYRTDRPGWLHFLLNSTIKKPPRGKQANWVSGSALQEARACIISVRTLTAKNRRSWLHNLTVELSGWISGYLDSYKKAKQKNAKVDFHDLLQFMRDGLRDNLKLRQYFQTKFDYLLVDEVQDMDPLQAEIVFFLSERKALAANWDQVTLKPGKLFLVGDPWQSIYGFRRADLEMYKSIRERIQKQGVVESIVTSYRMGPELLSWTNDMFSRVFQSEAQEALPRYKPLKAVDNGVSTHRTCPEKEHDGYRVFLLRVPESDSDYAGNRETVRIREARATAIFLRRLVEERKLKKQDGKPLAYQDMAVLCRTNQSVLRFEAAFSDAGITCESVDKQRRRLEYEVADIKACLRAIMRPADEISVFATLRSSLFGFSDSNLFEFRAAGGVFDYLSNSVPTHLNNADLFSAAFALLRSLRRSWLSGNMSRATGFGAVLDEVYTNTPLLPILASQKNGPGRIQTLMILKEALVKLGLEYKGLLDFPVLSAELILEAAIDEVASNPTPLKQSSGVRLSTIHRAKGLEYPLVVVPDLSAKMLRSRPIGLLQRGESRLDLRVGSSKVGCSTVGWPIAEAHARRNDAAEEKRLHYVAVTRAKEFLVFPVSTASPERQESNTVLSRLTDMMDGRVHTSENVFFETGKLENVNPKGKVELKQRATDRPRNQNALRGSISRDKDRERGRGKIGAITARRKIIAAGRRRSRVQHRRKSSPLTNSALETELHKLISEVAPQFRPERKLEFFPTRLAPWSYSSSLEAKTPEDSIIVEMKAKLGAWPGWGRVASASNCLFNVPFSIDYKGARVESTIQLAFLERKNWVIVAFRAGNGDALNSDNLIRERLLVQGSALDQLTPYGVGELLVFYAGSGQEIRLV